MKQNWLLVGLTLALLGTEAAAQSFFIQCELVERIGGGGQTPTSEAIVRTYRIGTGSFQVWLQDESKWTESDCTESGVNCTLNSTTIVYEASERQGSHIVRTNIRINRLSGAYNYVRTSVPDWSVASSSWVERTGTCRSAVDPAAALKPRF